ncbi:hypothetical protein NDU88_007335 [Pleurodeles waltl]|uniref:Uncharacterized protein n=1 Tax=Pleurodeles waltl TaxID=8319 RepID=A0AAV7RP67_PLEWA|nr:hypothetical protein NDU88_007335 [Pleurodeles waltl]
MNAPVTRSFLESLFTMLRDDLVALKQELVVNVRDIRCNVGKLEQRVDSLEQVRDSHDEELVEHRQKMLTLRDVPADLNYQLEDIENRLRHCNICIKGVPLQAAAGKLDDYVLRLFTHVALNLMDQDIILDRSHRAGQPSHSPGQPQDILKCLCYYPQKEAIMAAVRDKSFIDFEGTRVWLYQELSTITLQRRRALLPLTILLHEKGIKSHHICVEQ